MPALSEYSNVTNTAINILIKKGYRVWHIAENEMYCAEKNGWDFMADSPCGLLGIISIYEFKNPKKYEEYWWREEDISLKHALSSTPPQYTSVVEQQS